MIEIETAGAMKLPKHQNGLLAKIDWESIAPLWTNRVHKVSKCCPKTTHCIVFVQQNVFCKVTSHAIEQSQPSSEYGN